MAHGRGSTDFPQKNMILLSETRKVQKPKKRVFYTICRGQPPNTSPSQSTDHGGSNAETDPRGYPAT
ncbi:hypothetical protein BOTCAL_0112g00260 [Botryotinia calthae]|uniref:Uncharacterized protein n=1 Tax=Botryotinia calthae TaxID=38488 RepID=A0A4Y8D5R5_9HELO|nr:hypothetical protein BOTCAL_0112g00260 [Botryotinia calthae]